jgi:LPXTG-motif cell wall-anchored protein
MGVRRGEWRSTGSVWQDGAAESGGAEVPAYEEAIVRKSVRKFVGVALMALLGVLALPMLAAGAQTNGSTGSDGVPPDPPGACTFDVTPNPVASVPTQVTISGTAPTSDNTHVVLFVNGAPATANSPSDIVATNPNPDGTYTLRYTVTSVPADGSGLPLSVNFTFGNQNAYSAVCTGPGGITVIRVRVQTSPAEVVRPAPAAQAQAQALAFTGSSDTPSYVLIGIAAIVVGAVLVVAARRRSQVS